MPHPKILSSTEILRAALDLIETSGFEGLSLRALASVLGVKAPSLYHYFPNKEALEKAVAEEIFNSMLAEFRAVPATARPDKRFRTLARAYLNFARQHFSLYAFVVQDRPERYASEAGKSVWNLLLDAVSSVSGHSDDTDAAVALWSFLHGYAMLEHSGAFGVSGPKGGLERGLDAFLRSFPQRTTPGRGKTVHRPRQGSSGGPTS